MKVPLLKKLSYQPDSSKIYAKLKHLPWAAFLDSSFPFSQQGRYDIITANPYLCLQTHSTVTTIASTSHTYYSRANPFQLLKTLLTPSNASVEGIPFPGGALGFFSYDLSRQFEPLISRHPQSSIPDMMIGIYDWAITIDHHKQQTYLSCCHRHPNTHNELEIILRLLEQDIQPHEEKFELLEPLSSQKSFTEYQKAFNTIKQYLYNGDCYQVNLTHPFTARCQGSAWQAYQAIKNENPMPYAAFLNFNNIAILSLSPERFIHAHNNIVTATPIKGTCKRHPDLDIDKELAWKLQHCQKNRAENLMIVDLLRNDLSKVCALGTINVAKLFQLDSYTGIHHLSSTISGRLYENQHTLDILQACFPSD